MTDISNFGALYRVFEDNAYLRNLKDDRKGEILNKFESMIKKFNQEETKLLFDLIKDFCVFSFEDYAFCMMQTLSKINKTDEKFSENEKFIILPILKPEDQRKGESKSGIGMLYFFEHTVLKTWKTSSQSSEASIGVTEKHFKHKTSEVTTFFIDDFIGTGKTALDFLNKIRNEPGFNIDKIYILCIAILEEGLNKLEKEGYKVYFHKLLKKGIHDSTSITDKQKAYEVMSNLEKQIQNENSKYKYGYCASEGLIPLINTPNNTFPIFWRNKKIDGSEWPAPFPRS